MLVGIHQATHVHGGPGFIPWHREIVNRLDELWCLGSCCWQFACSRVRPGPSIGKNAVRCSVEDADRPIRETGDYVHRAPVGSNVNPVGQRIDRECPYPNAKRH